MALKTDYPAPIHIANDVYIQPNYFVIKAQYFGARKGRSQAQIVNECNLSDNSSKGELSRKAASNLRSSINWLIVSAKYKRVWSKRDNKAFWFKVNFITMTIPPQESTLVSEKKFQKCLNTWLTYARKFFYLHNYVWKIEAHSDGRLHIHLTTDTFINHRRLRESWNRILQNENLLDSHFSKFANYNPNSTDVHAVHKVKRVAAYMCEYMIKKPNLPKGYTGRIWSCSYSLSNKNKCHVELEPSFNKRDYSCLNNPAIKWKAIETKPDSMGRTKRIADLYLLNESSWELHMSGLIKDAYNSHRKRIRDATPVSPQEYRTIDAFAQNNFSKVSKQIDIVTKFEPCEIKICIQKIGLTQLDLIF